MKKKIITVVAIIFGYLILIGVAVGLFFNSNYYYSKKLVSAIWEENITQIQEIIKKKPSCINAYPSITSKWWHGVMDWRICYPLNDACATGNIEIVELLIENGADVNCNDGLTPLSIVYQNKADNWYAMSKLLIESGTSLDYITDYSGGKSSVLQDIVKVRSGAALPGYVPESNEEVIKAFNYALENVNHNNVNWMHVLQHSVTNDRIEIVKLLLDQKYCDVNDTSIERTALMFAAMDSTPEMVQLLLDYGADKSIKTPEGETAYDFAVKFDNKEIMAMLED